MTHGNTAPYNTLSAYLKQRFGQRVQKIPLDAGFTCPNRDGTVSGEGCTFCNPVGSGTGMLAQGLDLAAQWEHWRERLHRRYKAKLFIAYLQSYSNTYGPLERVQEVLSELEGLPGLVGMSLGTRPDCLDKDKLDLIGDFPAKEIQLEMGLQSSNDETLRRINRGHDADCFARAAGMAAERGIKVVAHLIAGLPGEGEKEFLQSIDFVSKLPIHGVKLQNLFLCRGTAMAEQYALGELPVLKLEEYASMISKAIGRLRPDIIVHRLNGDPAGNELVAPAWAGDKQATLGAIQREISRRKFTQGCLLRSSGSE